MVRMFLHEVQQPFDAPWSAAFVHHVGHRSHLGRSGEYTSWPLPPTGDCNELARFASKRGILSSTEPAEGEVYLVWSPIRREFIRAGVIALALDRRREDGSWVYTCDTIEGNTNDAGWAPGRWIHAIRRTLCPERGDRMIRWADLDPRNALSDPAKRVERVLGRIVVKRAA